MLSKHNPDEISKEWMYIQERNKNWTLGHSDIKKLEGKGETIKRDQKELLGK